MRVPDRDGEFRKLIRAISDNGWGIMAMGSVRSPRQPDTWDLILKVRRAPHAELMEVLQGLHEQEIVDVRKRRPIRPNGRVCDEHPRYVCRELAGCGQRA